MVTVPRLNNRGASNRGCLLQLLLFTVVLYYGINIGEVGYRYIRMQDEMRSQARLAPGISDDVILRRLRAKADELGLPPEAQRIRITRSEQTQRITIESGYAETIDLPFINHTFDLNPRAEAQLWIE